MVFEVWANMKLLRWAYSTSDLSKMMQLCGHSPKLVDVDLSEGDLIETRNPSIPLGL